VRGAQILTNLNLKATVTAVIRAAIIVFLVLVTAVAAPAAASATNSGCGVTSQLVPECGIWWGAHLSVGLSTFETMIGRKLAIVHDYVGWNSAFPNATEETQAAGGRILFIDWSATNPATGTPAATWAEIASGAQDAVINAEAKALRSFGRRIMLAFNAEPEGAVYASYGTAQEYVAAWRKIHTMFLMDGVQNVVWVWDVTGDVTDHGSAYPSWYPGDSYVNWIMWDPYNWFGCKGGSVTWRTFAETVTPMYSWLTANSGKAGNGDYLSKPWGLAEYGTVEGPTPRSKELWYESAVGQAQSQFPKLKALVYFDSDNVAAGRSCDWKVNSSVDALLGYKVAGHDSYVESMP
jgi:hypothetical protein